jgi:preprotein translocase subunit SecF
MSAVAAAEATRGGIFHRLYYGQTHFDFIRKKRWWFLMSAIVIVAGSASLAVRGLNFDIEFVGGTSWEVPAHGVTVQQARSSLAGLGFGGSTITLLGSGSHASLQVEAKLATGAPAVTTADQTKVQNALAALTHSTTSQVSISQVGPTWGSQITHKAVVALIVFFILIAIYISLFFEWKMAVAAIVAVLHDIVVTVGIYSLTGFLVTPDTVVAFLTILGYSLYDTIVVFDRVRDNTKGIGATGKLTLTDVVNLSMNQTLARSINTSLVAILPILAVLLLGADILGATTLQYFGLALLVGLTSGAYSSIFIASPLVAVLKEHEPRYRQIRQRLESRGTALQLLSPAAVAAGALDDRDAGGAARRRRKAGRAEASGASGPLRPGGRPAARQAPVEEEAYFDEADFDNDEDAVGASGPDADGRGAQAPQATPASGGGSSGAAARGSRPAAQRPAGQRPSAPRSGSGGGSSNAGNRPGAPRPRKKRRR